MAQVNIGAHEPLLARETSPSLSNRSSVIDNVNHPDEVDTPTSFDGDRNRPSRGFLSELQDMKSNAVLRAQGHEASMRRSFSPLAALGLGFRHVFDEFERAARADRWWSLASQTLGWAI